MNRRRVQYHETIQPTKDGPKYIWDRCDFGECEQPHQWIMWPPREPIFVAGFDSDNRPVQVCVGTVPCAEDLEAAAND